VLLFLYGIQNALKLTRDLRASVKYKKISEAYTTSLEPVKSGKGEERRKLYCLKFPRNYEVTGRKPSLSEYLIMRPKCVKTHVRASLISKIFPGLYPGPPLKREGPREGRAGKGREGKTDQGGKGRGARGEEGGRGSKVLIPHRQILDPPLLLLLPEVKSNSIHQLKYRCPPYLLRNDLRHMSRDRGNPLGLPRTCHRQVCDKLATSS
jgi:hypothetical protein